MKKIIFVQFIVAGIILAWFCGPVGAIEPIPKESGFDGFVRLGGGYSWVKSNMVAGTDLRAMSAREELTPLGTVRIRNPTGCRNLIGM